MKILQTIKINDKNFGGTYTIILNDAGAENQKYITCKTPLNCFGYENNIILYNMMQFDKNGRFNGYKYTAGAVTRYTPRWILNKIEKYLIKYSLKYNLL